MKELKLWSKFTTEWSAVGQHAASHQRLYGCLNDRGERCFWIDTPGSGPTAENAVPPNLACSSRVPAGYVLYPEAPAEEPKRQTLAEKLASRHDTTPALPTGRPAPGSTGLRLNEEQEAALTERTGPYGGDDIRHEAVVAALTVARSQNEAARLRNVAALAVEMRKPASSRYPHEGHSDRVTNYRRWSDKS
jgi:pyruvate/2-oxoglutarate dehydrogenase complex dihydrolipoamide acyltransferase (E2) component